MDLKAKAKYTLEVTSDEVFVMVKGLSKLSGEPGRNRDDAAYKLLDKLQSMVSFIERCEKAMDEAATLEPEPVTDRSDPLLAPGPPVPQAVEVSESNTEDPGTSGGVKGPPRPPTVTGRPLSLPPSILPPGPPPQPPKKSSTKKAKKKKGKS